MADEAPENQETERRLPENPEAAAKLKKRRTAVMWLRVIALLFAGLFFLSQCAMSKPRARAAIIDSCTKNVPFAERWQQDLRQLGLKDGTGALAARYCVCMWDEPLQKLSHNQIQSFAKLPSEQQLELLGGAAAFEARDRRCVADLAKPVQEGSENVR